MGVGDDRCVLGQNTPTQVRLMFDGSNMNKIKIRQLGY